MWFSRWVAGAPVTSVGSGTGARKGMALGGRAGVAPFSVLRARGLLSEVFSWEGGGGRHHQCVAYPAVTRGVSACASSVLGPQCSCVAELGSAQLCVGSDSREPGEAQSLLAPRSQRRQPFQVCAHLHGPSGRRGRGRCWRFGKPGPPCPRQGVHPFPGTARRQPLGQPCFSWSERGPMAEVTCHLPSPSVASHGDVVIHKVQVSASSFLGAICPTGSRVGGRRLQPRGQGGWGARAEKASGAGL